MRYICAKIDFQLSLNHFIIGCKAHVETQVKIKPF